MNVYQLDTDANRYQNFGLVDKSDLRASHDLFKGNPMAASWLPMRVAVIREKGDEELPPSDFPTLYGTIPVFSGRAVSALGNVLRASGELLPLECDEGSYFAYNVTRIIDALDEKASEVTRFPSSGRIMRIDHYEFCLDKLKSLAVFKLPQERVLVHVTDEFVRRVEESGLTGFRFVPVWSTEAVAA